MQSFRMHILPTIQMLICVNTQKVFTCPYYLLSGRMPYILWARRLTRSLLTVQSEYHWDRSTSHVHGLSTDALKLPWVYVVYTWHCRPWILCSWSPAEVEVVTWYWETRYLPPLCGLSGGSVPNHYYVAWNEDRPCLLLRPSNPASSSQAKLDMTSRSLLS